MAEIRRLNLSLNLALPFHRQVWQLLSAVPKGHRTDAVCRAVLAQMEQDALKNMLREVLREELKHVEIISNPDERAAEDDDAAILGFLRALQEGEDI